MNPKVELSKETLNEIIVFIVAYLDLANVGAALKKLKHIDWWPFNADGDEYKTARAEFDHNLDLLKGAAIAVIGVIQRISIAGQELNDPQKHAIAVGVLDRLIRLPWYLEAFDGVALDMLITMTVTMLKAVDWVVAELAPVQYKKLSLAADPSMLEIDKIALVINPDGRLVAAEAA